jgi:hypothetical protein
METIELTTRDGICPLYVHRPTDGQGPWPAVIVYMDAYGIRPATQELAERLAGYGYYAVLPDLYYRSGPYGPFDPKVFRANPDLREELKAKLQRDSISTGPTFPPAPKTTADGIPNAEREPDAFVVWATKLMNDQDNPDDLSNVWETKITPASDGLFKPDVDQLKRHYEARMAKIG